MSVSAMRNRRRSCNVCPLTFRVENLKSTPKRDQIDRLVKTAYNFRTVRDRQKGSTEYTYIKQGSDMKRPLAIEIRGSAITDRPKNACNYETVRHKW